VLNAARDGYPVAHGIHRLQVARDTILDRIETLPERNSSTIQPETPTALDDPLRALADLDRAVTTAASKPALRLAGPPHTSRVDVYARRHAFIQAGYEPPAPSAGIEI
jgi:hypothetical protein